VSIAKPFASVTMADLVAARTEESTGLYFFFENRDWAYVGKAESRAFIERVPSHVDVRPTGWFGTLLKKIGERGAPGCDPRRERARFRAYLAEAYVRTFAYVRNTKMALRWWKAVRRQPRFEGTTLVQLLFAIWHTEHIDEAREVAVALLPALDSLGPRVRVRVAGALRLYMIQVLRARP
jgi:hypothetical protein